MRADDALIEGDGVEPAAQHVGQMRQAQPAPVPQAVRDEARDRQVLEHLDGAVRQAGEVGADGAAAARHRDGMIDGAVETGVAPGGEVGGDADAAHAAARADHQDPVRRGVPGADRLLVVEEAPQRPQVAQLYHDRPQ